MSASHAEHGPDHEARIRLLVEGDLAGPERQAAELSLRSCLGCLTEYNAYRRFWRTVTRPEYRRAQEQHLRQNQAELYRQYTGRMEGFADALRDRPTPRARLADLFRLRRLHQPGFSAALLLILMLALPYFAYRSAQWRRERNAWMEITRRYQSQLDKQAAAEKAQADRQRQYESQIAALSRKMADRLQPDLAASYVIAPQTQRGADEAYPPVQFTPAASFLILTIRLSHAPPRDLTIEIADADRENVWRKSGVKAEEGTLSLVIPREFFQKGRYRVAIYRAGDRNPGTLISEFPLRIRNGL